MSRTLPTECEHGRIIDWGDFGDDEPPGCVECEQAAALMLWVDTSKPWEAAHRLREALGYFAVEWNVENRSDFVKLIEDEGVLQSCVRAVWQTGEFAPDSSREGNE